jgi:hypothetical protein
LLITFLPNLTTTPAVNAPGSPGRSSSEPLCAQSCCARRQSVVNNKCSRIAMLDALLAPTHRHLGFSGSAEKKLFWNCRLLFALAVICRAFGAIPPAMRRISDGRAAFDIGGTLTGRPTGLRPGVAKSQKPAFKKSNCTPVAATSFKRGGDFPFRARDFYRARY